MKKYFIVILLALISCNLFAYEKFTGMFGITKGMSKSEVMKHAESENWLLRTDTGDNLYYMPNIDRMIREGFYGATVPQIVVFFNNGGVSGFIVATDAYDEDSAEKILQQLDTKYGLEYYGIYKDHFLAYTMDHGGNVLMSWERSRSLVTGEVSQYASFTINMN